LGSEDYRYESGRLCGNKPSQSAPTNSTPSCGTTHRLAPPPLIRAEISKRWSRPGASDSVTSQRKRLESALAKASASVTAMIEAFSEQLITIDEFRARMPHLRARQANLRGQIDALDARPPTPSSQTTWKASSPGLAIAPPPPTPRNATECSARLPKTSSFTRKRSLSGTGFLSAAAVPAPADPTPNLTRRVTMRRVIHCVGSVTSPLVLNVALHGPEEAAGVRYQPTGAHAGDTRLGSPVVVSLQLPWPFRLRLLPCKPVPITMANGRVIAMTHAVDRPGYHDVNCQPSSYWIQKIEAMGYTYRPQETREGKAAITASSTWIYCVVRLGV
jgi:hypothetical protein